jgi:hypothetical protein
VLTQTVNLVRIVSKEIMPPGGISFFAAMLGDRLTYGFEGAETGSLKRFRFGQGAEDEDSIAQTLGNPALPIAHPLFLAVKSINRTIYRSV